MPFVLQDGTNATGANAYVDEAYFESYCETRGKTYNTSADVLALSVRCTTWIDGVFWSRFPGTKAGGREQLTQWPRKSAYDVNGDAIGETEIPHEIKDACCEAMVREGDEPGVLSPDFVVGDRIKRERAGPVETEYFQSGRGLDSVRPVLSVVGDILAPLLETGGSALSGRSVRI